jgi:hypothetical protein
LGKGFNDFVHGSNSGFCAFQLALLLGYTNIYLLGIDLVVDKDRTHYHKGYPPTKDFGGKLKTYLHSFDLAFPALRDLFPGVKVYSCSGISALNQYIEYRDIKNVLEGLKNDK